MKYTLDDELAMSKLTNPNHYKRMVNLVMQHNPACEGEDWAKNVINRCINQSVMFGDYATGMVAAFYNWESEKVRIFFEPLSQSLNIPADFPVQPLKIQERKQVEHVAFCYSCGLYWDDGKSTSYTPTPSGRCPFEMFHGREEYK